MGANPTGIGQPNISAEPEMSADSTSLAFMLRRDRFEATAADVAAARSLFTHVVPIEVVYS